MAYTDVVLSLIAEGGYGRVFLCKDKYTGVSLLVCFGHQTLAVVSRLISIIITQGKIVVKAYAADPPGIEAAQRERRYYEIVRRTPTPRRTIYRMDRSPIIYRWFQCAGRYLRLVQQTT